MLSEGMMFLATEIWYMKVQDRHNLYGIKMKCQEHVRANLDGQSAWLLSKR